MSGTTNEQQYRTERDSMGEMQVPAGALYGASTARAVENFPISSLRLPRSFIRALGLIKFAAARVNQDLGLLNAEKAELIQRAAQEVIDGNWDADFPIDVFQTGSGTSTNMNANEVIASRSAQLTGGGRPIHPNDDVNMCQSSNDVIPSTIHLAAYLEIVEELLPALELLQTTFERKAAETDDVVKMGRTHLMDAMPVRMSQEIGGWAAQVALARQRVEASLPRLAQLAIGGTAVGTGINAHPEFGKRMAAEIAKLTSQPFVEAADHFAALRPRTPP